MTFPLYMPLWALPPVYHSLYGRTVKRVKPKIRKAESYMKRLCRKITTKIQTEDFMDYTTFISQLLMIIAALVAVVNIITEVCKRSFAWLAGSKVINLFVLLLSVALTVAAFLAYWQIKEMLITWYIIAAFIIIGFMVAFAAMFGFDKLLKYLGRSE